MKHLAAYSMTAKQNLYAHISPGHPCFLGQSELRKEAGLRPDNLLTVPGQEAGAAWVERCHHITWGQCLGLFPQGAARWAKQTWQQSRPFGAVQILTAQAASQNVLARCRCDRAGRDGSRVSASLPRKAANLNCVHECQQVPWREEGRRDIGAAGGSIYSRSFLKKLYRSHLC